MKDPVIRCPSKQKSMNCSIKETSVEPETCSFCLYASCYKWRYLSHSTMFLWTEGNLGVYTPVFYCLWKYSKHGTCVKVDYCWAVYRFIGLLMPCALWTLHLQHASRLLLVHTYINNLLRLYRSYLPHNPLLWWNTLLYHGCSNWSLLESQVNKSNM